MLTICASILVALCWVTMIAANVKLYRVSKIGTPAWHLEHVAKKWSKRGNIAFLVSILVLIPLGLAHEFDLAGAVLLGSVLLMSALAVTGHLASNKVRSKLEEESAAAN